MKIAQVSPYDFTWPGGVTEHISHLSHQLIKMGHQVKILAPYSPGRASGLDPNVVPIGRSVPIPAGGSIARISLSPWIYRQVRQILREEQFDVVHLHEPMAPYLNLAVLQCSNAVNIGTFHAYHGSTRWYFWSKSILKYWFKKLDGHIAVSPAATSHVKPFFPVDYEVIPNGIDLGNFDGRAEPIPQYRDDKLNILFVGRMEKRKGLKYLLEAFGQAKWEHPNIRLIVVGPGSLDKYCQRVISERNLQDVVFAGAVDSNTLFRYYRMADIFCTPATGKESFGIVLLEAMAASKPILATSILGYSSIIKHGHQGYLVPPRDVNALAESLGILVKNPVLRKEMGARGRQAVDKYKWETVAQQVLDYYSTITEMSYGSKGSRQK